MFSLLAKPVFARAAVSDLKFLERGCARSVSRSASKILRLVFDTAALRQTKTQPGVHSV